LPSGTIRLSAEITYRVTDSAKSIFQIADLKTGLIDSARQAVIDFAGSGLAASVGPNDFQLAQAVTGRLGRDGVPWGVKIESVAVQRDEPDR